MLINFLFDSKFNKFINFIENIFSSMFFWIFIFFIVSILFHISFLKTRSIKNINNTFNKVKIISFIFVFTSNVLILFLFNVLIKFSFMFVTAPIIHLLNFIFFYVVAFFCATRGKYFDFIILFNKLVAIFFLIAFAPSIFTFIFSVFLNAQDNLFYLIFWVIIYWALIITIVINNNVTELKQIFHQLLFGFVLLLLFLILNLSFIENTKDIKLSTIFNNIFILILLWIYVWNVILMYKNKVNPQYEKENKEDLKFFVLEIKNNALIMDKPIKYTTIFVNGYKQVMII